MEETLNLGSGTSCFKKPPGDNFERGSTAQILRVRDVQGSAFAAGVSGENVESLVLEDRDHLRGLFTNWLALGAGILLAPTLRATPEGLKPLGVAHRTWDVNHLAMAVLREAAGGSRCVPLFAAQVGPCQPTPSGLSFDQTYIQYHEQAKALVLSGPDLVVIRKITDPRMFKAALVALRDYWSGPLIAILDLDQVPGRGPEGFCARTHASTAKTQGGAGLSDDFLNMLRTFDVLIGGFPANWDTDATIDRRISRAREWGFPGVAVDFGALPQGATEEKHLLDRLRGALHRPVDVVIVEGEPPRCSGPEKRDVSRGVLPPETPEKDLESKGPRLERERPVVRRMARERSADLAAVAPVRTVDQVETMEFRALARSLVADPDKNPEKTPCFLGPALSGEIDLDSVRLEAALRGLEGRTGHPLGMASDDPNFLEACAKAARTGSVLILDKGDPGNLESVFYIARRYGSRVVVPLLSEDASWKENYGRPEILRLAFQANVKRIRTLAEEVALPVENIYLNIDPNVPCPGCQDLPGASSMAERPFFKAGWFQETVEEIRKAHDFRWSLSLPFRPGQNRPQIDDPPRVELVVLRLMSHLPGLSRGC